MCIPCGPEITHQERDSAEAPPRVHKAIYMDVHCSTDHSRKLETTRITSIGNKLNKFWNIPTIKKIDMERSPRPTAKYNNQVAIIPSLMQQTHIADLSVRHCSRQ